MAVIKQIGELNNKEFTDLNNQLMNSGYVVVENNNEAVLVAIDDLTNALGHEVELSDLQTSRKEIVAAINEIYAYINDYVWIGTQAEYDEITDYEDMFYLVTDGGGGYDDVIDNSIVDVDTQATIVRAYKFYNADALRTFKATRLETIEKNAFQDSGIHEMEVMSDYSDTSTGQLNLFESGLYNTTKLLAINTDGISYKGAVNTTPPTVLYTTDIDGNEETVNNPTFEANDVVFNNTDNRLYRYSGSSWSEYVPTQACSVAQDCLNGSSLHVLPFIISSVIKSTTAQSLLRYSVREV